MSGHWMHGSFSRELWTPRHGVGSAERRPNLIYMQLDPWLALSMAPAIDRGWEQIHAVIGVISVFIRRDRVG